MFFLKVLLVVTIYHLIVGAIEDATQPFTPEFPSFFHRERGPASQEKLPNEPHAGRYPSLGRGYQYFQPGQ